MRPDAAAHLSLRNIVKSYDGHARAVDDVSIDIARGEFVTLLGPSGSGKTTTLMMIAGFEAPTMGRIELEGRDLTRTKPYRRNIGIVFQNYALFPHMTVARNVAFPLRMRGVPQGEMRTRVADVLALVGLEAFADKHPRQLSGGQQQRVALARGLVFNPGVLLLDEPLGALDKNLREQMQVEIKRIHREVGITMVYVTHDQTEAMTMSDRVAVFKDGRLEQIGPPLDVYNRPATRFVGEFIGDSNFLSGPGDVDLLVRPERIRIVEDGANRTGLNLVEMQVDVLVNYGDSVLAIGKAGGVPLRMRVAGTAPPQLREGATLTVGWAPGDTHPVPRT
jgi:putative spermidine/putrescine transport system ATP-binding protein